jgi:hypothetical protein
MPEMQRNAAIVRPTQRCMSTQSCLVIDLSARLLPGVRIRSLRAYLSFEYRRLGAGRRIVNRGRP